MTRGIATAWLGTLLLFVSGNQTLLKGQGGGVSVNVTNETPLSFGSLIAGPAAGTVTVSPSGERNVQGIYALGATGYSAAEFAVGKSGTGDVLYSLSFPSSVTLTGSNGGTMLVDGFATDARGSGYLQAPANSETRRLGATLHIGANQPAGTYSGVLYVTVNLGN